MAIERYKVEEFLYGNCNKVKRSGNGYVLRCPICGDSKKNPNMRRCNVDYYSKYDEWVYTCYNGGCPEPSGNIQSLYSRVLGVSWKEANDELAEKQYNAEKIKKRLDKRKDHVDEVDETGTLDLDLKDCYSLTSKADDRRAKRYIDALKKFHIDRMIPLKYKVVVAHSGKYQNRFIVPVYHDGIMVYFQGRSMDNDMLPKYLNPVVKKEEIVLNIDKFDFTKHIIVCEGLIDSYSVDGFQGTSCLGAGVNDEYLGRIYAKDPKAKIIIALDNPDTDESGYANYVKIVENSRYAKRLRYFLMPTTEHKDLNDLRVNMGTSFNMYDYIVENSYDHFSFSIKMKNVL